MLVQATRGQSGSAHVVVLGNEKGGSGKSTIALHIAVALLKAGQRVATIDLDGRQRSFTHYIENRRAWAKRTGCVLELPRHCRIDLGHSLSRVVTAEGVEDEASYRLLAGMGCDLAQGSYIAPPLPIAGLSEWLLQHQVSEN